MTPNKGKRWLVIKKHFLAEGGFIRLWNDLPWEMPGALSLELFQMRLGKTLENKLKC